MSVSCLVGLSVRWSVGLHYSLRRRGNYSVATNFCLVEPSAREVFIFEFWSREKSGGGGFNEEKKREHG